MPLSEHEQNVLAEIERQLARDDPHFVERNRRRGSRDGRARQLRWSIAGFVVGFVCLLGLTFHLLWAVVGLALMLSSAVAGASAVTAGEPRSGETLAERIKRTFQGRDHAR